MQKKVKENSVIVFAFCSVMLKFLLLSQDGFIYPRDRAVHIIISFFINIFLIYIIRFIDFKNIIIASISFGFIVLKIIYSAIKFQDYFSPFQGINSLAILIFTIVLIFIAVKLKQENLTQIYSFFLLVNVLMILLIIALSLKEINVINLYSTDLDIIFSHKKLIIFDEIFIVAILLDEKDTCVKCQKKLLLYAVTIFALFTLLQGFCIGGNVLYSLSPLQSLMQVFTTKTIKRFDYIISLLQALNYFATILFLIWAVIKIYNKKEVKTDETL